MELKCPKICDRIKELKEIKKEIGDAFVSLEDYYHVLDFPAIFKNKIYDYNRMKDDIYVYFVVVKSILRKFCHGEFTNIDDYIKSYGDLRYLFSLKEIVVNGSCFNTSNLFSVEGEYWSLVIKTPIYWANEEIPKFVKRLKNVGEELHIDASMLLEKIKSLILHGLLPLQIDILNDIEICMSEFE